MSIGLLYETQNEIRRLFIAGSDLAAGDFRLKKILPGMKKSGEAAPVFAKVAEILEKVIEAQDSKTTENLFELSNLVNAILYTQGQTGIEGEASDIENFEFDSNTSMPFRKIKPIIDALTTTGSGRFEIINEALSQKLYGDVRLITPLIYALDDSYVEIPKLVESMLEGYGESIVPVLKKTFDFSGCLGNYGPHNFLRRVTEDTKAASRFCSGKSYGRRIRIISKLKKAAEREFYLEALEKGTIEVRIAAIEALSDIPDCENTILELSNDKKKEIREAAINSLGKLASSTSIDKIIDVYFSKDKDFAINSMRECESELLNARLVNEGEKYLEKVLALDAPSPKEAKSFKNNDVEALAGLIYCIEDKNAKIIYDFLVKCMGSFEFLDKFGFYSLGYVNENTLGGLVVYMLYNFKSPEAYRVLESTLRKLCKYIFYAFNAAISTFEPAYVFENYNGFLKAGKKGNGYKEIINTINRYVDFENKYNEAIYKESAYRNGKEGKVNISFDDRWIKDLMAVDELDLVCKLSKPKIEGLNEYLLERLENNMGFDKPQSVRIVIALMQSEYKDIKQVVEKIIEHNLANKKRRYNYYMDEFLAVIRLLPEADVKGFEEKLLNI